MVAVENNDINRRLGVIESDVRTILSKMENIVSIDGPLGKLIKDQALTASSAAAAHKRIDNIEKVITSGFERTNNSIEQVKERTWKIWAGITAAGAVSGGIVFLLTSLFGGSP